MYLFILNLPKALLWVYMWYKQRDFELKLQQKNHLCTIPIHRYICLGAFLIYLYKLKWLQQLKTVAEWPHLPAQSQHKRDLE